MTIRLEAQAQEQTDIAARAVSAVKTYGSGPTAVHALDEDRVFAVVRSTDVVRIDLYTDPVPADPVALQAWLRGATNAVVEPGNDAVTWR